MNTDTFLEMGSNHTICEDYIINGKDPIPYIIISDGCSSSKHTDIGSMIICHLAKQYLKFKTEFPINYKKLGMWIIHNAESVIKQLGLSISCLDATLIVSYEHDNKIYNHFYGDGCLVVQAQSDIIIHDIEYSKNAPYYLSYQIDDSSCKKYDCLNIDKTFHTTYKDGTNSKQVEPYHKETTIIVYLPVHAILIASDGLQSFIKKEAGKLTQHLTHMDIIEPFIQFKSIKGEFLKRRLNKQMKAYTNENIHHFDDLSVGAFIDTYA